jgi:hypothetical protein
MNLNKYATRGLRDDINKFVEQQTQIPFTMKNIYRMLNIVIETTEQRMDKALVEVFDKVTSHADENKFYHEGWKTNSHYLLNEKFIFPYMCPVDKWHRGNELCNTYGDYFDFMEDFLKALCYITGDSYDNFESLTGLSRGQFYGESFEWAYFNVKAYKKGTMHFKFKDKEVWARFNQRIAKIKGFPLYEHKEKNAKQAQPVKPVILATISV